MLLISTAVLIAGNGAPIAQQGAHPTKSSETENGFRLREEGRKVWGENR
jgi:hypothetical protein